jgi:hypothetical protein
LGKDHYAPAGSFFTHRLICVHTNTCDRRFGRIDARGSIDAAGANIGARHAEAQAPFSGGRSLTGQPPLYKV